MRRRQWTPSCPHCSRTSHCPFLPIRRCITTHAFSAFWISQTSSTLMSNSLQKILVVQSDTRRATFTRLFDLKRARVAEAVAEHHVQKRLGYSKMSGFASPLQGRHTRELVDVLRRQTGWNGISELKRKTRACPREEQGPLKDPETSAFSERGTHSFTIIS